MSEHPDPTQFENAEAIRQILDDTLAESRRDKLSSQAQQATTEKDQYGLKAKQGQRAAWGSALKLTGTFTQASMMLTSQSTQASLKSTTTAIQVVSGAFTAGIAFKEYFETKAKQVKYTNNASVLETQLAEVDRRRQNNTPGGSPPPTA